MNARDLMPGRILIGMYTLGENDQAESVPRILVLIPDKSYTHNAGSLHSLADANVPVSGFMLP